MEKEPLQPNSLEKEPKFIIAEFEKSFQDWLKGDSDLAEKVKKELIGIYGYDEAEMTDEGMVIIKVPIGELSIFDTSCGEKDNKAFGENVLNFLKEKEVEFMVVISDKEMPEITLAIMKISSKDGEKLSEMIDENKGSLRCDASRIEGWSTFESE